MNKQNIVYPYKGILFCCKRNKVLIHAATRVNSENFMLGEISQTKRKSITQLHLHKIYRIGKFIELESKLEVIRSWGEREVGSHWLMVTQFRFGMMIKSWKW